MKQLVMLVSFAVLCLFLPATGMSGFLDDLLNPAPKKNADQPTQDKDAEEQPDLLEGIGGIFGIKKNKIDLFKKGLGVVEALQPIGEEEEITLGEAVAVEAFNRFGGEYPNPQWTRYVNLVGKTVAEFSDRPTLEYHFAILNSQEQNAFAAPGGYIFITVGLLKTLKNETELAGVLAHEIAHVTKQHMLETIRRGAVLGSVSELTLTAMKQNPEMFSNVIDQMTEVLFTKGLDKEKEFEADVVGVEYAYRAPRALASISGRRDRPSASGRSRPSRSRTVGQTSTLLVRVAMTRPGSRRNGKKSRKGTSVVSR